jgi:transposase
LGNPLSFLLSPGNRNEILYAKQLLEPHDLQGKLVLADMGYDSADFRRYIIDRGGVPVIPNRATNRIQWEFDEQEYKERSLVENLFMKLKNYRRFATRYEKLAASYLAVCLLAAILVWLF